MATTAERLTRIHEQIDAAAAAVEADDGASPVLSAVVQERRGRRRSHAARCPVPTTPRCA